MSDINTVEKAIISLDGGSYQKLMDAYLMKKYQFSNIYPLGVQTGTNKPTKGTPDSYVECDNGQYILIMYGSVEAASFSKLKSDILSCFDKSKLSLSVEKIAKIICAYTSTNLHIEQLEELKNLVEGVKIELIGIGTVAHDIVLKYHFLATRFLNIPIDSGQVFDIKEFINQYDASGMNAPLGVEFVSREKEIDDLKQKIMNNDLVIVSGASGIGKTRLVLEASKRLKSEQDLNIVCVKNNGQLLYNDVRETINDPGKYLLFLDDANHTMNLDSILQFCISKKADNEIDVKIVMTVRDYAKDFIKKIALNTVKFEEMVLNPLSIQDIQKILKEKFDVKNERYLRQITKIANGNIRLAIIAAISAESNGFLAINDATDIFRNFYTPIFDENRITENETVVLCAVAIFGPVMLEPNDGMQYILTSNNISKTEYIGICYRLNSIELLDLFEKSIIRISDQSFANYILEYMLIDKKGISIKDLLLNLFPKYSSKLIYAINTVLRLFNSKITAEYIQNEINEAWAQCNKSDEKEYARLFIACKPCGNTNLCKRKTQRNVRAQISEKLPQGTCKLPAGRDRRTGHDKLHIRHDKQLERRYDSIPRPMEQHGLCTQRAAHVRTQRQQARFHSANGPHVRHGLGILVRVHFRGTRVLPYEKPQPHCNLQCVCKNKTRLYCRRTVDS